MPDTPFLSDLKKEIRTIHWQEHLALHYLSAANAATEGNAHSHDSVSIHILDLRRVLRLIAPICFLALFSDLIRGSNKLKWTMFEANVDSIIQGIVNQVKT